MRRNSSLIIKTRRKWLCSAGFKKTALAAMFAVPVVAIIFGLMLLRTQAAPGDTVAFDIALTTNNTVWTYDVNNTTIDTTPMGGGTHVGAIRIVYPRDATWVAPTAVPTNGTSQGTVNAGRCGSGVACKMTQYTISGTANNLAEITNYINNIQLTSPKLLKGEINITLLPESIVSWIDDDGYRHFYERKTAPAAVSWTGAYNYAKEQTFHGLTGYLMSMTTKAEADVIKQYTTSIGTDATGYTAGIRFRQGDAAHSKVDGTIGYGLTAAEKAGVMPSLPTGAGSIAGITNTYVPDGFACTAIGTLTNQGCITNVPAVPVGTECPTAAAYDTEWYWVNPVDNGLGFFMGRAGGTNANAECKTDPLNQGELVSFWNGAQPQGGEPIMAYSSASSSFGWHDYSNNAGAAVYVEYSEGWAERGGGTYEATESYGAVDMPTDININHLRNGTNEAISADTWAPNRGLNDAGTLFFCSITNGAVEITGYTFYDSNCPEDGVPYPADKDVDYYYMHDSIANPVPFRVQRTTSGGNYVYKLISNGAAIDDFGLIRQVVVTLPTGLTFSATAQTGFAYATTGNVTTVTITNGANPSDVLSYLLNNVSLTASGLTNVPGNITVQVADFASTPATGDPGRTATAAAIPQPITVNYYRLGQTTPLQATTELIGLIGETYVVPNAPAITDYTYNSAIPAIGTTLTYSAEAQTLTYYYTYNLGIPVNFDLGGQTSLVPISNQTVDSGDYAIRPPVDPRVIGQKFTGWYTDNTYATLFDFAATPISATITIYAGFESVGQQTVIFHDSDGPAGTPFTPANPDTISNVDYNSTIAAPTNPLIEGYSFASWNTEQMTDNATCAGTVFNFANNYVTSETGTFDLYACYAPQANVTLYFRTTNTPATVQVLPSPGSRSVIYNGKSTPPTVEPISEGYAFTSWNTAPMSGTTCAGAVFDFANTRLTATVTNLYSCFTAQPDIRISFDRGAATGTNISDWPSGVPNIPYNSSFVAFEPDDPSSEFSFFDHWCLDDGNGPGTICDRAEAFDFSARYTTDVNLVANWRDERVIVDFVTPSGGLTSGGNSVTIHGAGFVGFNQNSYIQSGLISQLDGIYNSSTGHATSLTSWYDIKGLSNFTLTNSPTINDRYISFNGTNQSARSASAITVLQNTVGTIEMYHRLNAVGLAGAILYEHSATSSATNNGAFALVRNGSAIGTTATPVTFANNTCLRNIRGTVSTAVSWACPNNTNWTTYSNVWSRTVASAVNRPYIDSTYVTPTNTNGITANALSSTLFIASRNATSGWANVSIGSFRIYNRQLSDAEIRCNYLVDMARFQNRVVDISGCSTVTPHVLNVQLGGQTCTVTSFTNSEINCTAPESILDTPDKSGTVDVSVSSGDSSDDVNDAYTYLAPLTITSITPNQGSVNGGTNITIAGTGFLAAGTTVRIGNRLCQSVSVVDTATITCVVPASNLASPGTGTVDVSVVVSGTTFTLTNGFEYIADFITMGSSLNAPLHMEAFPSAAGTEVMDYMDIIISTSAGGYTISLKADNPNLVCQTNSSYVLSPLSASGNLANEQWGYGIAELDTDFDPPAILPPVAWSPVTTNNTAIIKFYSSATNVSHYVYFGAKLSTAQPACVYVGTVTFTASVGVDDP